MSELIYLPNIYAPSIPSLTPGDNTLCFPGVLNVGCFGAIRPMKNHLSQALAAMRFAKSLGLYLRFHVNASRLEVGGDPVLKNLRALFSGNGEAELVECPWMELTDFILYQREKIDIGMQVSMSETFNFVAANYVTAGIPMVVSKEIPWASYWSKTRSDSVEEIMRAMKRAWNWRWIIRRNQKLLLKESDRARHMWLKKIRKLELDL